MRKFYLGLCVALMALMTMTTSCENKEKKADEQLANAIRAIVVPHEIKPGYTVTEVEYANKVLTYEVEVPKKEFKTLKASETKANTLSRLKEGLFPKKLLSTIVDAKASVHYVLKSGSDSIDFTFDPEDFKKAE